MKIIVFCSLYNKFWENSKSHGINSEKASIQTKLPWIKVFVGRSVLQHAYVRENFVGEKYTCIVVILIRFIDRNRRDQSKKYPDAKARTSVYNIHIRLIIVWDESDALLKLEWVSYGFSAFENNHKSSYAFVLNIKRNI